MVIRILISYSYYTDVINFARRNVNFVTFSDENEYELLQIVSSVSYVPIHTLWYTIFWEETTIYYCGIGSSESARTCFFTVRGNHSSKTLTDY